MNVNNAVILGGGSGGLAVASRLKELLGDKISTTVVDKEKSFVMINLQGPSKELRERKETWGNYWTRRLVA